MRRKRSKRNGPITVWWDNPPGADQGVTIERVVRGHTYSRRVGPRGFLAPMEAAKALNVTREFIYRLVWDKKLKTLRSRGRLMIPLSSIKAYDKRRSGKRR